MPFALCPLPFALCPLPVASAFRLIGRLRSHILYPYPTVSLSHNLSHPSPRIAIHLRLFLSLLSHCHHSPSHPCSKPTRLLSTTSIPWRVGNVQTPIILYVSSYLPPCCEPCLSGLSGLSVSFSLPAFLWLEVACDSALMCACAAGCHCTSACLVIQSNHPSSCFESAACLSYALPSAHHLVA
ncbi:hypothetical protein F5Y12DRAFT_165773 [Xylaria sp. FL1777]|nr:hypothetical protein F5Y12DRAFT_165773 [Xylaria sp. FL1777]